MTGVNILLYETDDGFERKLITNKILVASKEGNTYE